LRLKRAAQHLEILQQRPALLWLQQTADHAIAKLAGAELVTAVVVAGDTRVETKPLVKASVR
jgi:hypothetical protein